MSQTSDACILITLNSYSSNLPISHNRPLYPETQEHTTLLILSPHVPPFWHGELEHSSMSVMNINKCSRLHQVESNKSKQFIATENLKRYHINQAINKHTSSKIIWCEHDQEGCLLLPDPYLEINKIVRFQKKLRKTMGVKLTWRIWDFIIFIN